jgi:hypothetical protein
MVGLARGFDLGFKLHQFHQALGRTSGALHFANHLTQGAQCPCHHHGIEASGTHTQLLASNPLYKRLAELQFSE